MDVHSSLQQSVGKISKHESVEYLDSLASIAGQNCCSQNAIIAGVNDNLHQTVGFVALVGSRHHRHWDLANLQFVSLGPGFLLGQADAAQLGIGENAVWHEPLIDREILVLDQVGIHDLEVVIGNVSEGRSAFYISKGPDAG